MQNNGDLTEKIMLEGRRHLSINNVESVGSNLEFYSSICGSPSILFNNISVAGNVK